MESQVNLSKTLKLIENGKVKRVYICSLDQLDTIDDVELKNAIDVHKVMKLGNTNYRIKSLAPYSLNPTQWFAQLLIRTIVSKVNLYEPWIFTVLDDSSVTITEMFYFRVHKKIKHLEEIARKNQTPVIIMTKKPSGMTTARIVLCGIIILLLIPVLAGIIIFIIFDVP